MLIDLIAGSKADYYKLTPVIRAIEVAQDTGADIGYRIIYIGSKYDFDGNTLSLSDAPLPGIYIEVEQGNSAEEGSTVLKQYHKVLQSDHPDISLIYGHSTGAMACAIAAAKNNETRIGHLGSGLRNNIRNSGYEVNRKVIDAITDYHFPLSQSCAEQLRNEGVSGNYIFLTGNPSADSISGISDDDKPDAWQHYKLSAKKYILLYLDNSNTLNSSSRLKSLLLNTLKYSRNYPVIVPITYQNKDIFSSLNIKATNLHFEQVSSLSGLYYLAKNTKAVITDTEVLQDEATIMQVPCMTIYKSVALPDTLNEGTNEVMNIQPDAMADIFNKLFSGNWKKGRIPYLWDGKAAERILASLKNLQ